MRINLLLKAHGKSGWAQPGADRRLFQCKALVGLTIMLAASIPSQALACGMPLAARIPAEQALIHFANGREEIVTSVQLQADRPGAAVIFPVPGVPEVSALANNDLFDYLAEVTRPEVRTEEIAIGPGTQLPVGEGAPGGGVNVLGREVIGGYDVARLQADDTDALQAWLDQNGYVAPAGAAPILSAYVDEAGGTANGQRQARAAAYGVRYDTDDLPHAAGRARRQSARRAAVYSCRSSQRTGADEHRVRWAGGEAGPAAAGRASGAVPRALPHEDAQHQPGAGLADRGFRDRPGRQRRAVSHDHNSYSVCHQRLEPNRQRPGEPLEHRPPNHRRCAGPYRQRHRAWSRAGPAQTNQRDRWAAAEGRR